MQGPTPMALPKDPCFLEGHWGPVWVATLGPVWGPLHLGERIENWHSTGHGSPEPKMDPKGEPKLRKNETWARWTANGRPMIPQSLQNGIQWDPQSSQNAPPNPKNGALETPKLTKWTSKLQK